MALLLLAANNAQSVLAAGISASATTMTLNTGTGALFPAPVSGTSFFKLTLIDAATGQISEIVHVTARTGDTLTIVRAQEGTLARAWSVNDIAANMMTAGTLSYILDNYATIASLGTASARNVGTGTNQIPDMASFTTSYSETGSAWTNPKSAWSKGPDGTIEQWGTFGFTTGQTGTNVTFPIPFPTRVESIVLTFADIGESQLSPTTMPAIGVSAPGVSRTQFTARMSGPGGFNLAYIARGR
ncbi:gp53-like domain-containing protein [Enterobacter asburiae]